MKYQVSDQAAPLQMLRVNVDQMVAEAGEGMKERVYHIGKVRNRLIDLLTGAGKYASDYEHVEAKDGEAEPPHDPGATAPLVDNLCLLVRFTQSPYTALDEAVAHHRALGIAQIDKDHPIAKHWGVVRDACYPWQDDPPDWPDLAALVSEVA